MWGKWCQTHIAENIVPHCKALVLPLRGWKEKMMFLILSIRCSWQLNTFLLVWIWVCLSHTHANSRSFRSAVIFFFTDTCLRWRALMEVLFVHSELIWLNRGCSSLSEVSWLRTYISAVSVFMCKSWKCHHVSSSPKYFTNVNSGVDARGLFIWVFNFLVFECDQEESSAVLTESRLCTLAIQWHRNTACDISCSLCQCS